MEKLKLKLASLTLVAAAALAGITSQVSGQGMKVDGPTAPELVAARRQAEKAWNAWEAQGHIEGRLWQMPAERALAEIRRSGKLADEYWKARETQLRLLGDDFRRRQLMFAELAGRPDPRAMQRLEEQNLATLRHGETMTQAAYARIEREPDPGRREAQRQAIKLEAEYYHQLAEATRQRIEKLKMSAQSEERFLENQFALIEGLRQLAAAVDEQRAGIVREREDWKAYHRHLEELVARNRGLALPKNSTPVQQEN